MKFGYSLPEIKDYFNYLIENEKKETVNKYHVPFGGKMEMMNVYYVPLDLPRYRLDNTRTIALQRKYIAENSLPEDYFEADVWIDKLQELQHQLLKKLIDRKDLKEYFISNEQTEPLILTSDGFVISGNRRLCAFRELFYGNEDGQSKFKRFERVLVVILPKCTEEDIEYIEDHFEQQPDIKDEFSWISRALSFRRRMKKHGYTSKVLAKRSDFDQKDIDSSLAQLSIAEEYLTYINMPFDYTLVEDDYHAFDQIDKCRNKKVIQHNVALKDVFQKLSFIALKNQSEFTGRMYSNIPIILEQQNEAISEIIEELVDPAEAKQIIADSEKVKDPTAPTPIIFKTLELLDDNQNEIEIVSIIIDKVSEYKADKEEKTRRNAVVKNLQKAASLISEAYNLLDSDTNKAGIIQQIENIESKINEIRTFVNNG